MIKIGAFAELGGVTIKTLRHYDKIGLLKPAHIDDESGYRYYTADQLLTIRRIAYFKKQGLTLEKIAPLLSEATSLADAEDMLLKKRQELERQLEEARLQINEIDLRLARIHQQDAALPEESCSIRRVEPLLVASLRAVVPQHERCLLLDELKQYVAACGEEPDKELILIRHSTTNGSGADSNLEVAIPLSATIPPSKAISIHRLPGFEAAASYMHRCNPYADHCQAIDTLSHWIKERGYRPIKKTPVREIYWTSDQDIYGQLRVAEILLPVERV
ncbi:MerR family transcriptional regulator [Paenibacillus sp. 598K]|uniref:MerR family transcriptional regulator n=1 Tax=Paenibacillus sp. 598K TaxID=1117987 RepID=UPI000FFAC552|nr:MerR family transcriptional regulator [Paenibacillus sp. 598K]GBF75981.1 MerR family transcriptional regulator [Paenibacillus sp. 598K]